jgi:hypothetical protein
VFRGIGRVKKGAQPDSRPIALRSRSPSAAPAYLPPRARTIAIASRHTVGSASLS